MILTSLARFCLENQIRKDREDELYIEALRALSAATGEHRVDIGGLQILFWSDDPDGDAFLSGALGAVADHWYYRSSPKVRAWLDQLASGTLEPPKGDGAFHVLGLIQSESSPVIRFWITDTFQGLADRVRAFWDDLSFAPSGRLSSAVILHMIQEASVAQDFRQIAPQLTQDLLAAMLSGSDFPPRLLQTIVWRIRKDGEINGHRAAVLKALLARRARLAGGARTAPAELDAEASDSAYLLGRLFAVFDAVWTLDEAVRPPDEPDARPSALFRGLVIAAPELTTRWVGLLSRLRLAGARRRNGARAKALARDMNDLTRRLQRRLPASLSLENQARFALGLYQQQYALAAARWARSGYSDAA